MMERDHDREGHARDVMDNPEWSAEDIRAGCSLADFAPEMAKDIARVLGRPGRGRKRPAADPKPKVTGDQA